MANHNTVLSDIEVSGAVINAFLDALQNFKHNALRSLAAQNIENVQSDKWYPVVAYLDVLKELIKYRNLSTLLTIGKKIPTNATFPEVISSFDDAMRSIDIAYHMNHRKKGVIMFNSFTHEMLEGIGHYTFNPASPGQQMATMICTTPYPCDFDRGIIDAMVQRFKPVNRGLVTVKHKEDAPCRKNGASSCEYSICW